MLDFPNAPTNQQQFVASNGVTYVYDAAPGMWLAATDLSEQGIGTYSFITPQQFGAVGDGVTDDTVAFQAVAALGTTVYVPIPPVAYLITDGRIAVSSNTEFVGIGSRATTIKLGLTTLNPLFVIGTSTNVTFRNLHLVGNQVTQQSASSGSAAILGSPGCTDIIVDGCIIEDFTRHGISLDGVTRATISNNLVRRCFQGAGILTSNTVTSTDVKVTNNTVTHTHMGNIQAFQGVDGWIVTGNYCDTTNWGSLDVTQADNITSYQLDSSGSRNFPISNNVCRNSGNHGIHIGVSSSIISNNVIFDPIGYGVIVARYPNEKPTEADDLIVSNNRISFNDNTSATNVGIGIRNYTGFALIGNVITNAYHGFEIRNEDPLPATNPSVMGGSIVGNVTRNIRFYSVMLLSNPGGNVNPLNAIIVAANSFNGDSTNPSSEDIRWNTASTLDDVIVSNNHSSGAVVQMRMLQATGSNSGSVSPTLKATGSAPDISIVLEPKGTGHVLASSVIRSTGYFYANYVTAIGPGSATQQFVRGGTTVNLGIFYGTGDPTFSAGKGSIYTRTDATTTTTRLWVNTNGTTTWTNLTTAA